MVLRNNRRTPRAGVTKSVVLDPALVHQVVTEAANEGHNNFSQVVAKALREFFARKREEREVA